MGQKNSLTAEEVQEIYTVYDRLGNLTATARECGVDVNTVKRHIRKRKPVAVSPVVKQSLTTQPPVHHSPAFLPEPAPEAGGPSLPEPIEIPWEPFIVDTPGHVGILNDSHIPYHDKRTIEAWIAECKTRNVSTILLNGDVLDCGEVSSHYREPNESRLEDELDIGERFMAYLRATFPRARLLWKLGNHEERIPRYIANNAPALFNIKALSLESLLHLDKYGVEVIGDKRTVMLGKLPVVHGHEFRGGGGVNPARWLFLRAVSTAMCGHFHRTSEHHEQGLDQRIHGVWSVGCSCFLYPKYDRNNKWNHGYALVSVESSGHFQVTNRKILRDGRVA